MSTASKQIDPQRANELEWVHELVGPDMARVDHCVRDHLASDVVLVNQVAQHIVAGGGKRLRPMLVLLAAKACSYQGDQHIQLAAVIEFIHTATLLHDDVVDESGQRRGNDTANTRFGNAASVLVGDFLYSRAFQMMVETDSMAVMDILADATNTIAEGEVLQLMYTHDPNVSEGQYLQVISCKTAKLFQAAARLGAVLGAGLDEGEAALGEFGLHLGLAFQIADDALDYDAKSTTLGKNAGDDLAEGKPTLPLIYAMRHADPHQAASLRSIIESGSRDDLDRVLEIIKATGALQYANDYAVREAALARAALDVLPESSYRDAMAQLADYAVARSC